MPTTVIKAEGVSKMYRLGVMNSGSLKQDLLSLFKKNGGQASPYTANEQGAVKNELWALRDVSFSIQQGEAIGFVGKNGAGKSTLLKILSKTTLPTAGTIKGRGKVSSLLEVGTGFHPELTGKENIFLNGQILGMKKREIVQKFDEIVAFSGVERFIDTPVKRYSSGMYLRLSFAVAAHLDADILIVDEALAVGDADFQAKCLDKMRSISTVHGRTVLFVSHNMQVLRDLCSRAFYLQQGNLIADGQPNKIIEQYLSRERIQYTHHSYPTQEAAPGNQYIKIKDAIVAPKNKEDKDKFDISDEIEIVVDFWNFMDSAVMVGIHIYDFSGTYIVDLQSESIVVGRGIPRVHCTLPAHFLAVGSYFLSIDFIANNTTCSFRFESCLSFDLQDNGQSSRGFAKWTALVKPPVPVLLTPKPEQ
jgi:lipopolysaccharide transport system ATP-binding protein